MPFDGTSDEPERKRRLSLWEIVLETVATILFLGLVLILDSFPPKKSWDL